MNTDKPSLTPQQYEVLHGGGAEAAEIARERLSRRRFLRRSMLTVWGLSATAAVGGARPLVPGVNIKQASQAEFSRHATRQDNRLESVPEHHDDNHEPDETGNKKIHCDSGGATAVISRAENTLESKFMAKACSLLRAAPGKADRTDVKLIRLKIWNEYEAQIYFRIRGRNVFGMHDIFSAAGWALSIAN